MRDPHFGVGFALPCFWEVNTPEIPALGPVGSYPLGNYSDEYVFSFPRGEGVYDNGGIKIDMDLLDASSWGVAPGTSLNDFVSEMYANNSETVVVSTEEMVINGQDAILVTTESTYGKSKISTIHGEGQSVLLPPKICEWGTYPCQ